MKLHYGLQSKEQITSHARKVVSVLGGGFTAERSLIEIAATETNSGTFPDSHPEKLGVGLTQFDQIGFDDVQKRTRRKDKDRVLQMLGYDIDRLVLADLAFDPLLALVFTRLKYKLIPEEIPETVEGRAKYWKQHYNSDAGKGSAEEYLERVKLHA